MGGRVSAFISSFSRQSTFDKKVLKEVPPVHDHGRPFVEMLKDNPHYGEWSNEKIVYEISLVHCQLHWYLLVKKANSMRLPFITLEVRTNNMISLVPWQNTHSVTTLRSVSSTFVGTYVGTLHSLGQMADDVVKEMGVYDLLTSNCQCFCNRMLKRMDMPEFETTYRQGMIDKTFDRITEDLTTDESKSAYFSIIRRQATPRNIDVLSDSASISEVTTNDKKFGACSEKISYTATKNSEEHACAKATVAKHDLKKAVPTPTVNDLDALHKIFVPIKDKWIGIGSKLHLQHDTLHQIEKIYRKPEACLREMLRKYLQQRNAPPLWEALVHAAEEYSLPVANSITRRAEYIRM